jgi:hypothetical protein
MSTEAEKRQAIARAVTVARRRLEELNAKPHLSKAELYERDMTLNCIDMGERILKPASGTEGERDEV